MIDLPTMLVSISRRTAWLRKLVLFSNGSSNRSVIRFPDLPVTPSPSSWTNPNRSGCWLTGLVPMLTLVSFLLKEFIKDHRFVAASANSVSSKMSFTDLTHRHFGLVRLIRLVHCSPRKSCANYCSVSNTLLLIQRKTDLLFHTAVQLPDYFNRRHHDDFMLLRGFKSVTLEGQRHKLDLIHFNQWNR